MSIQRRLVFFLALGAMSCYPCACGANPADLAFGPGGNFYVTGTNPEWGRIWRYDGATGAFLDYFTPDIGSVSHFAFGPDGQLDVTSGSQDHPGIVRFDGDTGELLEEFGQQQLATVIGPELAYGSDGNLYALRQRAWNVAKSIVRFDGATGSYLDTVLTHHARGWLSGMVFGDDGDMYLVEARDAELGDRIVQIIASEGTVREFAQLSTPSYGKDLAFGPDGHLYLSTQGESGSVLRFHGSTGESLGLFTDGGPISYWRPLGLTFGPDGHLYVGDAVTSHIYRFDGKTGDFIDEFAIPEPCSQFLFGLGAFLLSVSLIRNGRRRGAAEVSES